MSSSIGAEKIKVDFFEEWGLTRSTAYGIVVERNGKFVPTDSSFNKICGELFNKHAYFFAARFFQDDSSKKISIECFQQQPEPLNSKDMIQRGFLSDVFGKTAYHLVLSDSAYHILYNGDSIHFVSGVYYNHKKVCAEKSKEKSKDDAKSKERSDKTNKKNATEKAKKNTTKNVDKKLDKEKSDKQDKDKSDKGKK
jgi:hypothetical protein